MDFENAPKLSRAQNRLMPDALSLQTHIEAVGRTRKLKDSQSISREFKIKKLRVSTPSNVSSSQPLPVVEILDVDCESCAKIAAKMSTRLGKGESGSNLKKTAAKKEKKGAPNKGTVKKDSEKATAVASEDRELTKKKAVLAAAAFEKWVAEKTK